MPSIARPAATAVCLLSYHAVVLLSTAQYGSLHGTQYVQYVHNVCTSPPQRGAPVLARSRSRVWPLTPPRLAQLLSRPRLRGGYDVSALAMHAPESHSVKAPDPHAHNGLVQPWARRVRRGRGCRS